MEPNKQPGAPPPRSPYRARGRSPAPNLDPYLLSASAVGAALPGGVAPDPLVAPDTDPRCEFAACCFSLSFVFAVKRRSARKSGPVAFFPGLGGQGGRGGVLVMWGSHAGERGKLRHRRGTWLPDGEWVSWDSPLLESKQTETRKEKAAGTGSDAGSVPVPGMNPFGKLVPTVRCGRAWRAGGGCHCRHDAAARALLRRDGASGWKWTSQPGSAKANRKANGEQPLCLLRGYLLWFLRGWYWGLLTPSCLVLDPFGWGWMPGRSLRPHRR